MKTLRLALIGFGNVGQGFAQILIEHGSRLAVQYGVQFKIVAVADLQKGSVADAAGLDPQLLLQAAAGGDFKSLPEALQRDWAALDMIAHVQAEVLLELAFTDLQTGEPAYSHVKAALQKGMHVVTTNKGPVALHYAELSALAQAHGVQFAGEGTVMSGTPTVRLGQDVLRAAGIRQLEGILNGTTNYILTQMESGLSYAAALAQAQALGYAEADPAGDVEGHDAAGKVVILANLLLGVPLRMADVSCQGITGITSEMVADAQLAGERWKLVGRLQVQPDGSVQASVQPQRLPLSHPLANISGATNALAYTTDLVGTVTVSGPGAGRLPTGFAILSDLLAIARIA
jgi:homoserine dehydrogenase